MKKLRLSISKRYRLCKCIDGLLGIRQKRCIYCGKKLTFNEYYYYENLCLQHWDSTEYHRRKKNRT